MAFLGKIRNIFRRDSGTSTTGTESTAAAEGPRYDAYDLLADLNGSGLGIATVYRCVNLLADSVANLPLLYMRQRDGVYEEDVNSRLHYLLTMQPCEYMSAFDFKRQIVQYLLLEGNAYIVPIYNPVTMDLDRLSLVDPCCVSHDTVNDIYTVNDFKAGVSGVYDENEIIHVKNYSRDGKTGMSTIGYARTVLSIARIGDAETYKRFANGGNVRGIVSNDTSVRGFGEYQDSELAKTAKDLDQRFQNGQRIVSLPGQAQFSPISLSSTDMQFLETRKFSVREICRFFGVHPSFVFDDTSNNYKSAEMANVAFLSNTLNPLLVKIENEFCRKLVPATLCCKRKFLFDRRELYACDLDSKINYQTKTIAAGLYTVNEWRKAENKPPVPGGDKVFVSANLKGIDEVAQPTAASEPVPETTTKNNNSDE